MLTEIESDLLERIRDQQEISSGALFKGISSGISFATLKRILSRLVDAQLLEQTGRGRSTRYSISSVYDLLYPLDVEKYFEKEIDERVIRKGFNFNLIPETLTSGKLFTRSELHQLTVLQEQFRKNTNHLTTLEYKREMERLAIDLSWKSSQIEGNTYSLLETERLLKERETASGKTREEATMLLNHKEAIDFLVEHPGYLLPLSVSKIENIHGLLIKDLNVSRNIRKRRVGITGTNYRPLENVFQLTEALEGMCDLVNGKENVFEKALLALTLIAYIQPFTDGNKRTARIVSNGILMEYAHCPLSFRTVDPLDYKKAMLLFYEQNNLSVFKAIFLDQFRFAVNTYF